MSTKRRMSGLIGRLNAAAVDPSRTDRLAADAICDAIAILRRLEQAGTEPAHPYVSTPVDPRSDCSLTHWVVRL